MKENTTKANFHLDEYLGDYIANHNYRHAVLINGKWGIGKTFYIKEKIKKWKEEKEVNENGRVFKPLYVSLYGINKLSQINEKLKEELHPIINSKTGKQLIEVMKTAIKVVARTDFDLNKDGEKEGQITYNINALSLLKSDTVKGSKILVFDDIERCKIDLNLLFGYLNEFVEHHHCKVILLANEEQIKEKEKIGYNTFKEKLIGQTFLLELNTASIIENFVEQIDFTEFKKVHKENPTLIQDIFEHSDLQNLRILNQALNDFRRFCKQIDVEIRKESAYEDYIKHLAAYFFAMYFEYKGGNKSKIEYYGVKSAYAINIDRIVNKEQGGGKKNNNINIDEKYLEIITKYHIYGSSFVTDLQEVYCFIENGYSDKQILNDSIRKTDFFREGIEKNPPWVRLWRWTEYELEEKEFEQLYTQIQQDFNRGNITNIHILLHHLMILLDINKAGIFTLGNKACYIEKYKKSAREIIDNTDSFQELLTDSSWGYGYLSRGLTEYEEILEDVNSYIEQYNKEYFHKIMKTTLEGIENDNIEQLNDAIQGFLGGFWRSEERYGFKVQSYWKNVDISIFGGKVKSMDNRGVKQLIEFFWDKYRGNDISWFYPEDLGFYQNLKAKIMEEVKAQKKEEHYMRAGVMADFSQIIDKCIERTELQKSMNEQVF